MACSLQVNTRIWDDHNETFASVAADRVVLSRESLKRLQRDIKSWLESPDVGIAAFEGDYSLAASRESAALDLVFCSRADVISSSDKPVVTIAFDFGRMKGEISFVTDQSCLGVFATELLAAIPN